MDAVGRVAPLGALNGSCEFIQQLHLLGLSEEAGKGSFDVEMPLARG